MSAKRPFAVFDIDGTLIRWQLYHAIVAQLADDDIIDTESYREISDAYDLWKKRDNEQSFHHYEKILLKVYMSSIGQVSTTNHQSAVAAVFAARKDEVYTYTLGELRRLKSAGYVLLAISGSHQEIVELIGDYYGFDHVIGSRYTIKDGYYTTEEYTPAVDGKDKALAKMIDDYDLDITDSYGFGDTRSDISMLKMVDNPIAFNPNAKLFDYANNKHWPIVVERKNMIYKLIHDGAGYKLNT